MGVNLGLKPVDLKAIEMKHRASPDLSFQDMLEVWLKNTENVTTWKDLSNALHAVGMVRMATDIERKYNIIPLKEISELIYSNTSYLYIIFIYMYTCRSHSRRSCRTSNKLSARDSSFANG